MGGDDTFFFTAIGGALIVLGIGGIILSYRFPRIPKKRKPLTEKSAKRQE